MLNFLTYTGITTQLSADKRVEFMNKLEDHIIKNCQFLNTNDLIAVLFCYLKAGSGSNLFYRVLIDQSVNTLQSFNYLQ